MLNHLEKDLVQYHQLLITRGCSGWNLMELLGKAINSDRSSRHQASWKKIGNGSKTEMSIRDIEPSQRLHIKSGAVKEGRLALDGPRMSRFNGDFSAIGIALQSYTDNIIAVIYEKMDCASGKKHQYQVAYVNPATIRPDHASWQKRGKSYQHTNRHQVRLSLRPSESWRLRWRIPLALVEQEAPFIIA